MMKWSAAMTTVPLLVAWIGSAWWGCSSVGTQKWSTTLYVFRGRVEFYEPRLLTLDGVIDVIRSFGSISRLQKRSFEWWFEVRTLRAITAISGNTGTTGATSTYVAIPIWSLALLTASPAAWMFRTDHKRRRAHAEGLCSKCGYDLRGQLAAGCPECGWDR